MRFYQLRVDPSEPCLPWDELRDLVGFLPRESATVRAMSGERARWGEVEHLLAVLIDLAQGQMYQFASVNSRRKPKRPRPYPRPGVDDPNRRKFGSKRMSIAEARAWMNKKRGVDGD